MRLLVTIIIIILISLNNLFSQEKSSPVEIPILLSGTFGEFRKTHFHTGVDIKTQGKEGLKIKARYQGGTFSGYIGKIDKRMKKNVNVILQEGEGQMNVKIPLKDIIEIIL